MWCLVGFNYVSQVWDEFLARRKEGDRIELVHYVLGRYARMTGVQIKLYAKRSGGWREERYFVRYRAEVWD